MTAFLIAIFTGPIGRWLAGTLFVLALAASIYAKGRIDGRASLQAKIDAREATAKAAAKVETDRVVGGDRSKVKGFDRD